MPGPDPSQRDIYTIGRLNSELRHVLEGSFPLIWVQGEISNLSTPRSGHLYFSLKDGQAQIRCALFRNRRNLLRFVPRDGEQVLARARVTLYEPRGDCQLVIEHMEPAGAGSLRAAFEALKARLQAEGLFDTARKRPLPAWPQRIGVITSPSGAALRDILHVLKRRYPVAEVILYPSTVQGADAATELRQALAIALARAEVDVLILARGGGAEEDLAAFNDEGLARDIAAAAIPIVSAVGHETDFTIADFVADRRAPTPSAAAELVTPDGQVLRAQCQRLAQRLKQAMHRNLRETQKRLLLLQERLSRNHPGTRLQQQQQRLDELQWRLQGAMQRHLQRQHERLQQRAGRLRALNPGRTLSRLREHLDSLQRRLHTGMRHHLDARSQHLAALARQLQAVSPLATLERGYSIVLRAADARLVTDANQVAKDEELEIRLARGRLRAQVTERMERE
jgi:exodeoxyribonuclease VII large subunit